MSTPLAVVLYSALCLASVALWLDHAIHRAFRGLRITP